jgi:hypothetical protein
VTSVKIVNVADETSVFAVVGFVTAEDLREIAAQLLTYATTRDRHAGARSLREHADAVIGRLSADESPAPAQRVIDPARGDHYGSLAIQPLDYIIENGLDFITGNVVKYVTRAATTDDVARALVDVRKARHYVDLMERMWASRESEEVRRD